jgi:hypothetical protein
MNESETVIEMPVCSSWKDTKPRRPVETTMSSVTRRDEIEAKATRTLRFRMA